MIKPSIYLLVGACCFLGSCASQSKLPVRVTKARISYDEKMRALTVAETETVTRYMECMNWDPHRPVKGRRTIRGMISLATVRSGKEEWRYYLFFNQYGELDSPRDGCAEERAKLERMVQPLILANEDAIDRFFRLNRSK